VNVKLNEAPGARGPELNAPPVAVQVCVTVSLFVTVTVDPTGTDMLAGLKANPEMVIAAWTRGIVVVVVGAAGGWVVGGGGGVGDWFVGCGWIADPGAAAIEGAAADGGVVGEGLGEPGAVGAAPLVPLFGAPAALTVVVVLEPFPAGGFVVVVVVVPWLAGREPLDRTVVVDRAPVRTAAPPHAAVSVPSANPTSNSEARVR
jgi:hypothetical protein